MDRCHAHETAAPVLALPAWSPQLAALTQQHDELSACLAARQDVDRLVNRLMRDMANRLRHACEGAGDLLRRPALAKVCQQILAQAGTIAQLDRATAAAVERELPGVNAVIAERFVAITPDFPGDSRGRTAQLRRDPAVASALVQMTVNEIPLDRVNVFERLPLGNTRYPAGCCPSNLRPPSLIARPWETPNRGKFSSRFSLGVR